ncbi:hypothetical protein Trydic_g21210 [Trypoxylus dichotomus]
MAIHKPRLGEQKSHLLTSTLALGPSTGPPKIPNTLSQLRTKVIGIGKYQAIRYAPNPPEAVVSGTSKLVAFGVQMG